MHSTRAISRTLSSTSNLSFLTKAFVLLSFLERVGGFSFTDGNAFYLLVVGAMQEGGKFAREVYCPAVRNIVFKAIKEGACGVKAAVAPDSFRYPYPEPMIQELGATIIKNIPSSTTSVDECLRNLVFNAISTVEAEALANPPQSPLKMVEVTITAVAESQSFLRNLHLFVIENFTPVISVLIALLVVSLSSLYWTIKQDRARQAALAAAQAQLAQGQAALLEVQQAQANVAAFMGELPFAAPADPALQEVPALPQLLPLNM